LLVEEPAVGSAVALICGFRAAAGIMHRRPRPHHPLPFPARAPRAGTVERLQLRCCL